MSSPIYIEGIILQVFIGDSNYSSIFTWSRLLNIKNPLNSFSKENISTKAKDGSNIMLYHYCLNVSRTSFGAMTSFFIPAVYWLSIKTWSQPSQGIHDSIGQVRITCFHTKQIWRNHWRLDVKLPNQTAQNQTDHLIVRPEPEKERGEL